METAHTQTQKEQMEVALMRFGIIAPLVQCELIWMIPCPTTAARRVALTPRRDGCRTGGCFIISPGLWQNGTSSMKKAAWRPWSPRTRCDKGGTRVIPEDVKRDIRRLRKEYPRLNTTQVREKLVQEKGTLPATVSVSTIQRYIKHNGLKGLEDASVKDRKAYEEEYFGGMWQAVRHLLPACHTSGKMGNPAVCTSS